MKNTKLGLIVVGGLALAGGAAYFLTRPKDTEGDELPPEDEIPLEEDEEQLPVVIPDPIIDEEEPEVTNKPFPLIGPVDPLWGQRAGPSPSNSTLAGDLAVLIKHTEAPALNDAQYAVVIAQYYPQWEEYAWDAIAMDDLNGLIVRAHFAALYHKVEPAYTDHLSYIQWQSGPAFGNAYRLKVLEAYAKYGLPLAFEMLREALIEAINNPQTPEDPGAPEPGPVVSAWVTFRVWNHWDNAVGPFNLQVTNMANKDEEIRAYCTTYLKGYIANTPAGETWEYWEV